MTSKIVKTSMDNIIAAAALVARQQPDLDGDELIAEVIRRTKTTTSVKAPRTPRKLAIIPDEARCCARTFSSKNDCLDGHIIAHPDRDSNNLHGDRCSKKRTDASDFCSIHKDKQNYGIWNGPYAGTLLAAIDKLTNPTPATKKTTTATKASSSSSSSMDVPLHAPKKSNSPTKEDNTTSDTTSSDDDNTTSWVPENDIVTKSSGPLKEIVTDDPISDPHGKPIRNSLYLLNRDYKDLGEDGKEQIFDVYQRSKISGKNHVRLIGRLDFDNNEWTTWNN